MNIQEIPSENNLQIQVVLQNKKCYPEEVVKTISSIEGFVDLYCWYEGPEVLPQSCAQFYKDKIFAPLLSIKKDVKLCPYSLRGWNFTENVDVMKDSPLGDSINKIDPLAVECFYASSFFKFCNQPQKEGLQKFFDEELIKKKWLFKISAKRTKSQKTVEEFFNSKTSIFKCINGMDVAQAYSVMQYVEGYYLVRESVENGLKTDKKKIEVIFVFQNDEYKYYKDFSIDIAKMLTEDFGQRIDGVQINITFQFFREGQYNSRLYLDKTSQAVEADKISSYFDFLNKNK